MFRRLAYVSRPRENLPVLEIPRIVTVSRAHNEGHGITGVLLFTGIDFVQVIEGSVDVVASLWARIGADPRHQAIVKFLDEPATSRWYPDWRVGFPSDTTLVNQIAEWHVRPPGPADAGYAELRRTLAACDPI
ncbi:MAG: BLUF domain-containing protein [Betaproteobacteria bacterium]